MMLRSQPEARSEGTIRHGQRAKPDSCRVQRPKDRASEFSDGTWLNGCRLAAAAKSATHAIGLVE